MGKVDVEYPDILTVKNNLIITQIRTIPITMRIGRTKTIMQTNVIQITMSIGIAGKMTTIKEDTYV